MWLCIKISSRNMVLLRLLQIGAKDLRVMMAIIGLFILKSDSLNFLTGPA